MNLGHYHDLYFQSDTLVLVDAFESFTTSVLKYTSLIQLAFYQDQY